METFKMLSENSEKCLPVCPIFPYTVLFPLCVSFACTYFKHNTILTPNTILELHSPNTCLENVIIVRSCTQLGLFEIMAFQNKQLN